MYTLYPHQQKALSLTRGLKRRAFFLDMGLGKSILAIEALREMGGSAVLICQLAKIYDWTVLAMEYGFEVVDYTKTKRPSIEEIESKMDMCPVIVLINYESFWRRPELLSLTDVTLILDESSLVQNPKAKQTRGVLKMNKGVERVILLSGTPCSGKYENLWSQAQLLGWDISRTAFENTYVNWETFKIGMMTHRRPNPKDPYLNVERLKEKFRTHGSVFMKTEDVMHMPEQNFIRVDVSTSKDYRMFLKDRIISIGNEEIIGDNALTYRLGLRKLTGIYSEAKQEAFKALIQSTNERLVVFYNFNREFDALKAICDECGKPVSEISGRMKDERAFRENSDGVILCQYQAASMGLNLQEASRIIYYSLPERSDLYEQSKKRIHRIGQQKPCFYYLMVCKGSIEEWIGKALAQKKDFTDELFREHVGELGRFRR